MIYTAVAIVLLAIAVVPAVVARRKGHSFAEWYIFGVILWVLATPLAFKLNDKRHG